MCPKLCLPINLIVPGWHPRVEMVSGMSVHFRSYPTPLGLAFKAHWQCPEVEEAASYAAVFPFICIRFQKLLTIFLICRILPSVFVFVLNILSTWNTLLLPETVCQNSAGCSRSTFSLKPLRPEIPSTDLELCRHLFCTTSYDLVSFSFVLLHGVYLTVLCGLQ